MGNYIDLLSLLDFYKGSLPKVGIIGRAVRKVDMPSNINRGVKLSNTGSFIEVDVFALDLGMYDAVLREHGFHNEDNIYMVNGSMLVYAEANTKLLPDWYYMRGTVRYGTKDRRNTYIGMLNYVKKEDEWYIMPCTMSDVTIAEWDRESDYYYWMNKSYAENKVCLPEDVLSMVRFESKMFEPKPKENGIVTQQPFFKDTSMTQGVVSAKEFKKECRNDVLPTNENYEKLKGILNDCNVIRTNFLKDLCLGYTGDESDKHISKLIDSLIQYKHRKPAGAITSTGKALLSKYLSRFWGSSEPYIAEMTCSEFLISMFEDVGKFILNNDFVLAVDGSAWNLCKIAFSSKYQFYAGMLSSILGIDYDTLMESYSVCDYIGIDFVDVVRYNPYLLCIMSGLSFTSAETLAYCYGRCGCKDISMYRDIAMLDYYIRTTGGDTLFTKQMLASGNVGLMLTKAKYNMVKNSGFFLQDSVVLNGKYYLSHIFDLPSYDLSNFKESHGQYTEVIPYKRLLEAIENYKTSGIGVVYDNYITSMNLLSKELFIYDCFRELGEKTFSYDLNEINKLIGEYEASVGFSLEERQRQAVIYSVHHAGFILAGGAGSGKTTVSKCIVYVLENLEPELEIQFAAPTGKAAKRMQEVVQRPVSTIHSKFKIGASSSNDFIGDGDYDDFGNSAFFIDEGAMITIDLLYSALRKIDLASSRVYLFGDFNQLPPLGKGRPFKNLLRFMPCVFLNVTKRAVEGSNITANANYICDKSGEDWQDLVSNNDFLLLPCKSEHIQSYTMGLCKYFLGTASDMEKDYLKRALGVAELPVVADLTADDIQVVTPFAKPTYSWGAYQLNALLQPKFNTNTSVGDTFYYQLNLNMEGNKFIIGDRVIHIDSNMYSMQWYSTYQDGEFQKVYGCGIFNGEVGKIVDFVNSNDCIFKCEKGAPPEGFKYKDVRNDSNWHGDNKYFVVVEYYDYISERKFYILYRAEVLEGSNNNTGMRFKGDDLAKLNLFYAGTTHRLQGSQAKVIICPLDQFNKPGFITREMLYTMVTRGEKLVIMLGSVYNSSTSMLYKARKDNASAGVFTVGEILV